MNEQWTEQNGIDHNKLTKKIYYVNGKIDGLTDQEFNQFCKLNSKLERIVIRNRTAEKDYVSGQADKKAGYYDKWYRYNRIDNGAAYDNGFNSVSCENKEGINIIECMHN